MTKQIEIQLQEPIKSGDSQITSLTIRKPNTGEMRGIKLLEIMQFDVGAYEKLLPRIMMPVLTTSEFNQISTEDISDIMLKIAEFFEKKDYPND